MPEWIYRNTDAREYNQRDTFHFSAGKILLHTKINILLLWKNFSRASSYICLKHFVDKNFNQLSHSLKWLNKGSLHTSIFYRKSYTTPKQHISFIHLSVLPISPDNNDLKKRKEKKNQVKISLAPFYGGGLFSPLYATWLTSSHSVRNTHKPAQLIFVPL